MTETITMQADAAAVAAVPPPPPPRRPRVREVSSRFMSPQVLSSSSSSSSPSKQQRSVSAQRSRRHLDLEPSSANANANANVDDKNNRPETFQCPERERERGTPLKSSVPPQSSKTCKIKPHQRSKSSDSGNYSTSGRIIPSSFSSRPDTPASTAGTTIEDRLVPQSRLRIIGSVNSQQHRSVAARLLRSSVMSSSSSVTSETPDDVDDDVVSIGSATSDSDTSLISGGQGSICTSTTSTRSSPIRVVYNKCKTRSLAELRSSMPEADMLPTRLLAEKNCGNEPSRSWDSPCSRSLNLPLSSNCENENSMLYNSVKPGEKVGNFVKAGGGGGGGGGGGLMYMPPRPPRAKQQQLGLEDARKGRKVSSHQEDVHSLRMLHNHYLQWRYANAKADVSMDAQRKEAEVSDLRNDVRRKRIELELLRRTNKLSSILEAHIPDLDEWSALEVEYSFALSETIQALVNASLQLPITGNVRADTREVGEALNSALKLMDMITFHVQRFVPKAEEMDRLISELARVIGGERTLVEDCGELLSKTHASQVEECSLRGQLMQLQCSSLVQIVE